MSNLAGIYAELIAAAAARPSEVEPDVAPLLDSERRALVERYDLDERIRTVLFARYPRAGIRLPYCDGKPASYEGSMILPSLDWLAGLRDEDPKWPRAWFPVAVTGDHYIQFLTNGTDGVFALHNDDFHGDTPYESGRALYASFEAFVLAAVATLRHLRPDAFDTVTEGRWIFRREVKRLREDVAADIRAQSCKAEDGPPLLPQTGVDIA